MSVVKLREVEGGRIEDPRQIDIADAMHLEDREVHPFADLFPMLDGDSLRELAEDIKQNGLLHPIVVTSSGVVIDGRNRLAACKIAGVEPRFTTHDGKPQDYIVSANINRRHLNPSQRIMAWAMLFPEPEKGFRTKSDTLSAITDSAGLSAGQARNRLSQARFILKWGGEQLARQVMYEGLRLDAAYEKAKKVRDDTESEEGKHRTISAEAPDLARQIVEETLSLEEAWAALTARKDKQREEAKRIQERRAAATGSLCKLLAQLAPSGPKTTDQARANFVRQWLDDIDPELWPSGQAVKFDSASVLAAVKTLQEIFAYLNGGVIDE